MNRKRMEMRVAQLEEASVQVSEPKPALMFAIGADDDERTVRGKAEAAAAERGKTIEDFGMWLLLAPLQPLSKKDKAGAADDKDKLANETLEQVQ